MAGLGLLVAGVAHEINSPSAAIRGSIDGLANGARRASRATMPSSRSARRTRNRSTELLEQLAPQLAERPLPTGLTARKVGPRARRRLDGRRCQTLAAELADLGATTEDAQRARRGARPRQRARGQA